MDIKYGLLTAEYKAGRIEIRYVITFTRGERWRRGRRVGYW